MRRSAQLGRFTLGYTPLGRAETIVTYSDLHVRYSVEALQTYQQTAYRYDVAREIKVYVE